MSIPKICRSHKHPPKDTPGKECFEPYESDADFDPRKMMQGKECCWDQDSQIVLWMHDMVRWGKRVRDDILRLEKTCNLDPGDPGDPPTGPWK